MNKITIRKLLILGLVLFGIFIKLYYIDYTDTWERQHDVISFGAEEGHAAYIEYILDNKALPDFDPREKWGFFQPPLHHIISAGVMSASEKMGLSEKACEESTQIPTCIYMISLTLMALFVFARVKGIRKIFAKSNKGEFFSPGNILMLCIVSLHPMFILMSGSINNDALALFLSMLALIIAAAWYERPNVLLTLVLALTVGFAMLAKLTGGLVAVPIGMIMLMKFFGFNGELLADKNTKINTNDRLRLFFRKYFAKAVFFAVIVFPLGLSFSIRNKVKWNVPINYIPPVGEVFPDTVSMSNRLFDIGTDSVYTKMMNRGDSFDEYNVILALIKTSLFGEYSFADISRWMKPLTLILFISAIILIVFSLIATCYVAFSKKCKINNVWKTLLMGTYITYLAAYFYFALSSNNFSAQDFRYAGICIVCQGIFAGLYIDAIKNKKVVYVISAVGIVFAASSFLTYALLGFKS